MPAAEWPGSDLIASTDALVAKAGYGTVCEAMACGTPMVYPPRQGFSEFRALDRSLRAWGGGIPVSTRDFQAFRLDRALDRAFHLGPLTPPFPTDGADRIAGHLARLCRADPPRRQAFRRLTCTDPPSWDKIPILSSLKSMPPRGTRCRSPSLVQYP